jgi:hypothetical protein
MDLPVVGGFFGLLLILSLVPIGLAIWALVDLARKDMDGTTKVLWVLVILFFPIIGSIASLIINRAPASTTSRGF